MASLRTLLSGLRALTKKQKPLVQIDFSKYNSPRVQRSVQANQPLLQEARRAQIQARPTNVIRNAPKALPRLNYASKIKNPIGRFAGTAIEEVANAPRDVLAGSLGVGANIADIAYGKKPVDPLRNIGTMGAGFVNAYAPKPIKGLVQGAGKQSLRELSKRGFKQGATLGALGGGFYGIQEGENTKQQLLGGAKGAVFGGAVGGAAGAAIPAVSQAFKSGKIKAGLSIEDVGGKFNGQDDILSQASKYKTPEDTVTLYHGSSKKLDPNDLNYGTFLTANKDEALDYARLRGGGRGKVTEVILPKSQVRLNQGTGEYQYIGKSKSLQGKKYPEKIYQALNDAEGSNMTAKEIDLMDLDSVRDRTSMALEGGRDEFDQLTDIWNQAKQSGKELPPQPKNQPDTSSSTAKIGKTNQLASDVATEVGQPTKAVAGTQAKGLGQQADVLASSKNPSIQLAKGELVDLDPAVIRARDKVIKELQTEKFNPDKNVDVKQKVNVADKFKTPADVYEKIGLGKGAEALRLSEIKAKREIEGHITQIQDWVKRAGNRQEQVFDVLDGKTVPLTPDEEVLVGEIRDYLSTWAERLGLPKDKQITNYITHIFDEDLLKKEFDPDLAKLIANKVPGSVYDPFLQQRYGIEGYKKDLGLALQAYAKRGVRKANFDPVLKVIKENTKKLELSQVNYVKKNLERINLRPTDLDNSLDNFIKSTAIGYKLGQRPTQRATSILRTAGYRGGLGLNVGSAIKNLTQGVNTYAKLGEKYTLMGYMKALRPGAKVELERVGVLSNSFIDDTNQSVYKSLLKKMDTALFYAFEKAEQINRGAAYFGAKNKAIHAGKSVDDAILEGLKVARETQFTFGNVDTPQILSSDIAKTVGQFQSFNLKQAEFLTKMVKSKDFAGMARWIGANAVIVGTIGKLIGYEGKDVVPFSSIMTGETKLGKTPALGAIGTGAAATANVFGAGIEGKYNQPIGGGDFVKSLASVIPGGVQARKTYQGLGAYGQGASTSASGRVRYPVERTPGNLLRTSILGQYSSPYAKTYFDTEMTPLGDKDTLEFQQLVKQGADPVVVWKYLARQRIVKSWEQTINDIQRDSELTAAEARKQIKKATDRSKEQLERIKQL